jgi:hypothetical protein
MSIVNKIHSFNFIFFYLIILDEKFDQARKFKQAIQELLKLDF